MGIFLSLLFIETAFRTAGYILSYKQMADNLHAAMQKDTYKIMCLGESTTAGQYPHYLEEILNNKPTGIKFEVIDKGIGGTSTAVILSMLKENLEKYKPDMVITMMGINDGSWIWEKPIRHKDTWISKVRYWLMSLRIYKLSAYLIESLLHKNAPLATAETKPVLTVKTDARQNRTGSDPPNAYSLNKLAETSIQQGEYEKAENLYIKALKISPSDYDTIKGLCNVYFFLKEFDKAIKFLKNQITATSYKIKHLAYYNLGCAYRDKGNRKTAKSLFKQAIKICPMNTQVHEELAALYTQCNEFAKAREILENALKILPNKPGLHYHAANLHYEKERTMMLEKVLEFDPSYIYACNDLLVIYLKENKLDKAEEMLKNAIASDPDNEKFYNALMLTYFKKGESALSNSFRATLYPPQATINNYNKLKETVLSKGIKLVCVQYPVRALEPLRKILEPASEIVFVDNEKIFKDALKKHPYSDLFIDSIGGDFGHCTPLGNKLLAKNIADAILKKCFNKK